MQPLEKLLFAAVQKNCCMDTGVVCDFSQTGGEWAKGHRGTITPTELADRH